MSGDRFMELLVQLRRRYSSLDEGLDLTRQMAQALDRNDRTSFGMLLSMRQEVILRLQELEKNIEHIISDMDEDTRQKWQTMLEGVPQMGQTEQLLIAQIEQNRKVIVQLKELDDRLDKTLSARRG